MPTTPEYLDFAGIAHTVDELKRDRRLGDMVRRAGIAQSCIADLREAADCVEAADRSIDGWSEEAVRRDNSVVEAALLLSAVVLYARATSTDAKKGERGPVQIASTLNPEQRVDHEALLTVRNRALAHVYAGDHVDGVRWHQTAICLVSGDDGWQGAALVRRVSVERETLARLKRQIPIATDTIQAVFQKRLAQALTLLTESVTAVEFDVIRRKHAFDAVRFLGSAATVEEVLASRSRGWARGTLIS